MFMVPHLLFLLVIVIYYYDVVHIISARAHLPTSKNKLSQTTKRWIPPISLLQGGGSSKDDKAKNNNNNNIGWMIPPATLVERFPEESPLLPPPPPPPSGLESYREEDDSAQYLQQPPPPPDLEHSPFFYMPPPPLPPYPNISGEEEEEEEEMNAMLQQRPFFYPQQQQQQQQPQDFYLHATVSALQHQLEQSEYIRGNLSETCIHYQTLCKTLQTQLESCQEDIQERKIKMSKQDLSIVEYQDQCEKLLALLSSQNQTIREYQQLNETQQQSIQNITNSYTTLHETHKKGLDDLITLSAAIEKYRMQSSNSLTSTQEDAKEEEEDLEETAQVKYSMQDKAISTKLSFWEKLFSFFLGTAKSNNLEEDEMEEPPVLGLVEEGEEEVAEAEEKEEDSLEQAQKLAHRSLIDALTQSREHISELETLLEQQEQTASQTQHLLQTKQKQIQQMHDRVSILEEDTSVRKAAWKQLQNELKVEETKRIDLEQQLKQKYEEIETLEETIKHLQGNYSAHLLKLERENQKLNRTLMDHLQTSDEIDVYVDRLEQRLVALSRAKENAVLEAKEAASNLTAVAIEQQKESQSQLHRLQENLRTMQQEHVEETTKYQEQLATLNETIDLYIAEKHRMEGQLEQATKERDRLLTDTSQMQLQMSELHWKLEAARCQVELLTSQAATANERQRLQAALDEYCSEEEEEEGEVKNQNSEVIYNGGFNSTVEAASLSEGKDHSIEKDAENVTQFSTVNKGELQRALQPDALEYAVSNGSNVNTSFKKDVKDEADKDEAEQNFIDKAQERREEIQPSMSPIPETPVFPDPENFSDDESTEEELDIEELDIEVENHIDNEAPIEERREETLQTVSIPEADVCPYDDTFSDEESLEDEEEMQAQAVTPMINEADGAIDIKEILPLSSQTIGQLPNADSLLVEKEKIELQKENLTINETQFVEGREEAQPSLYSPIKKFGFPDSVPIADTERELSSKPELKPSALSPRFTLSDGAQHGEGLEEKEIGEASEPHTAVQKQRLVEKNHGSLEIPISLANKGNSTLFMLSKRLPQEHKKFRQIRKKFSRMTGLHGFFSGSSYARKRSRYSPPASLNARFQTSKIATSPKEHDRSKK